MGTEGNEIIVKEDAIITKELEAYNTTVADIAKAREQYMPMTAEKDGVEKIHAARIDIKGRRVNVTKAGEKLRAGAVAFQKRVIARQKDLIALLEPIEAHLEEEENRIEEEKKRLKAEEEARIAARTKERVGRLIALGCSWNGTEYAYGAFLLPMALITVCDDEQFDVFHAKIQEAVDKKKAEEKAAVELLLKVAAEQEKKREEAEAEQKRIKAEQDRIAAEQEAERKQIEKDKKALQDEKDRIEKEKKDKEDAELRAKEEARIRKEEKTTARTEILALLGYDGLTNDLGEMTDDEWARLHEAAQLSWSSKETARIQEEARAAAERLAEAKRLKEEADAKAKAEKEEKARLAAERKAARAPDKVKIKEYAFTLSHTAPPQLKTAEAKDILIEFEKGFGELLLSLSDKAEAL